MPKNSPAKLAASNRYVQRRYMTISTRARRSERLDEQIALAATRANETRAAYILGAIKARLERDGIGPGDLPPLDDDTTT